MKAKRIVLFLTTLCVVSLLAAPARRAALPPSPWADTGDPASRFWVRTSPIGFHLVFR